MNLVDTWQQLTSDPMGITLLLFMGACVLALLGKGGYELWNYARDRAFQKREARYRAALLARTHTTTNTNRSRSRSTPAPTPIKSALQPTVETFGPEEEGKEGGEILLHPVRVEEANTAFIVMRSSKDFDLLHTMIYFFIEQYGDSIAPEDQEWANEKLDEIHLHWLSGAREGDRDSFTKLFELWDDGLWPDEDRETLPTDWEDIVSSFATSRIA